MFILGQPPLVQVANSIMSLIVTRCISDIKMVHKLAEISKGRLGQDVPVIIRQDKNVENNTIGCG